jgi:hypothetical protein
MFASSAASSLDDTSGDGSDLVVAVNSTESPGTAFKNFRHLRPTISLSKSSSVPTTSPVHTFDQQNSSRLGFQGYRSPHLSDSSGSGSMYDADTQPDELTSYQISQITRQQESYNAYITALNKLKPHVPLALINNFYQPSFIDLVNENHYQDGVLVQNVFLILIKQASELTNFVNHEVDAEYQEESSVYVRQFILDALYLANEVADLHNRAKESGARTYLFHHYENRMIVLGNTIHAANVFLRDPSLPNHDVFSASILTMQNCFEHPSHRFIRKRPYLSAFIATAVTLLGMGMMALGILMAACNPVASIVLSTAGAVIASLGASTLLGMLFNKCFKTTTGNCQIFETVDKTTDSARALLSCGSSLFHQAIDANTKTSKKTSIAPIAKSTFSPS